MNFSCEATRAPPEVVIVLEALLLFGFGLVAWGRVAAQTLASNGSLLCVVGFMQKTECRVYGAICFAELEPDA